MSLQNRQIEQCTAEEVVAAIVDGLVQNPVTRCTAAVQAMDPDIALGKQKLATAITAKGVSTTANQALETMAANVGAIQQETIEIDGGEMYAKQLFGVKDNSIVPGYWNLYEVMAYLLSKTSTEQYSILLCEIPKGDAEYTLGTAVTPGSTPIGLVYSDDWQETGEGSLNIHSSSEAGHTWNDDLDMKGNRWVAWLFAQVVEGATAPTVSLGAAATNCPQPRSIHIGRHIGIINSLVGGRLSEVIVTDGNKLDDLYGDYTQWWDSNVVIRTKQRNNTYSMFYNPTSSVRTFYIDIENDVSGRIITDNNNQHSCMILKVGGVLNCASTQPLYKTRFTSLYIYANNIQGDTLLNQCTVNKLFIMDIESMLVNKLLYTAQCDYLYFGYKTNDSTKSVSQYGSDSRVSDIELMNGWLKNINISMLYGNATAENIALHLLAKLGTCTAETGQLTLKIGATNLATIQNDSTYSSYLTEATTTKGWAVIA